ncbi:Prp31 C-terminal, partial [Dillenia turbinata]
ATLADSFLADLEELSDNEADLLDEDDMDASKMEEDVDGDMGHMEDIEALNYDDLDSVSKLQKSQRYIDIMKKVQDALEKGSDVSNMGMVLEDDPEYQLIVDCNALSVDIENEIAIIHNFIRDKYRLKFPELESLVHHPIDYARVVKKIGNEMDLTLVDLEGLLPSAIIMVVSVTASTTSGKPLSEENLQKTIDACDRALALDLSKKKVLDFVESRMGYIAPNLSAIVGSAVAAKLMGTAGGLTALAKMPACNVQLLGAKKKTLAGFSTATSQFRVGFLELTEIFQSTPPSLRMRACRLLAAKSTLAARVDSTRGDPEGKAGRAFREEIRKKIEKYATTDMRKLANRMQFGVPEESSLGDGLGEGYGMLGQAGSGKLRVSVGQSKLAAKVAKKFKEKNYGSSGATSGLTSSLAFTPVQGIELTNPQAYANQLGSGTQSTYFSETGTFSKIKRT